MNDLAEIIRVGIADMNIAKGNTLIRTSGLGSCVGLVLYDLRKHIGGMVHIMLPDSSLSKGEINKAKYADTAIPALIHMLERQGVKRETLLAKIAGGSQMFQFKTGNELMRIGPRNVEAVKAELLKYSISLTGEDVGGNSGRTIEFNPNTGILTIRTVNKGSLFI